MATSYNFRRDFQLAKENTDKGTPIVCYVRNELQAAIVTKRCQDYGIHSIIQIKPYVDISLLKKILKNKLNEKKYDLCPCGKGKKFKFCCYEKELHFDREPFFRNESL